MELSGNFTTRAARAAGVSRGILRSPRIAAPFHGVRSVVEPLDHRALCAAYAVKMRTDAVFTGVSAAMLWGIPLPMDVRDDVVHVATPHGAPRAGGRGVLGSQFSPRPHDIVERDGMRVLAPARTWVSLGRVLGLADLVAAGDHLITRPFGSARDPLCTPPELLVGGRGRFPGSRLVRVAGPMVRVGPLSRPESLARVLCVTGGLPEPECNLRVSPLLMFDLAWPRARVALDYHGAQHRSAAQHAKDVGRLELSAQQGWDLIQVTASDLFDAPFSLLGTLRARLSARGERVRVVDPRHVALPVR